MTSWKRSRNVSYEILCQFSVCSICMYGDGILVEGCNGISLHAYPQTLSSESGISNSVVVTPHPPPVPSPIQKSSVRVDNSVLNEIFHSLADWDEVPTIWISDSPLSGLVIAHLLFTTLLHMFSPRPGTMGRC